jgi:hypothetical protein
VFDHVQRLTDGRGIFEHALYNEPRPEHGYCLDDAARALVVICREPNPSPQHHLLARVYLDFTLDAVADDGACHNRMSTDGSWSDVPDVGDWWGRALWALGTASVHGPTQEMRAAALAGFRKAATRRSPHLRAVVFAALGAGELLLSDPDEVSARVVLRDVLSAIGSVGPRSVWPWPEARLSYGNGAIVEALLLAGAALPDPAALRGGLLLLDFLLSIESRCGHLSVTPVGGRGPGEIGPVFDQQPIEVSSLADACARAYALTGDDRWLAGVRMAWAWFLGDNDSGTPMFDAVTGGGFDGLESDGANLNQGAESTLAVLSTAQHAQRLSPVI